MSTPHRVADADPEIECSRKPSPFEGNECSEKRLPDNACDNRPYSQRDVTQIGCPVTLKRVVTTRSANQPMVVARHALATVLAFPVPHSDIGLVRGLRAGQLDAARALCDRYGADMLRVAMRILGPDTSLRSLVSDATSRAVSEIELLDDPRTLRSWLISHLISAVRQRLRARRRRELLNCLCGPITLLLGNKARERVELIVDSRNSEMLVSTYRVLDSMGDGERIVLCLASFDRMDLSEIATVMGTSVARVRRMWRRAEERFERIGARKFGRPF